jgi:gliding motility-associated lipoprotein GldH
MKRATTIVAIAISLLLAVAACTSDAVYDYSYTMPDEQWNRDSILIFNVEVTDTVTPNNILFCNRITGQYLYSNMYLFITIVAPDRTRQTDTLECILADKRGKWLGRGFGSVWSNTVTYKHNVVFPRSGVYTFYVEQAMRIENLPHVLDAGLRIEQSK